MGESALPDHEDTRTEMRWEAVVAVYQTNNGAVYVDTDPLDTDDPNLAVRTRGIFGDIPGGGGPFNRQVPIFNIGATNDLTITGATLTGADAGLFTVNSFPDTLNSRS